MIYTVLWQDQCFDNLPREAFGPLPGDGRKGELAYEDLFI